MSKKGCVYFVKDNRSKAIKVGYTKHHEPSLRIRQLSTSSPYGVTLIDYVQCENPKQVESEIHEMLNHVRLSGEWFKIDESMVSRLVLFYSGSVTQQYLVMRQFKIDKMKHLHNMNLINEMVCFNAAITSQATEEERKSFKDVYEEYDYQIDDLLRGREALDEYFETEFKWR